MGKKIYLSYSYEDVSIIDKIKEALIENGYETLSANDVKLGEMLYNSIFDFIKTSDYFVILLSENYINSEHSQSELNRIMGYAKSVGKSIFPVLLEDVKLPLELSNILYLNAKRLSPNEVAEKLIINLGRLEGEKLAKEEKTFERTERIKVSISDYIEPTIADLKQRESKLKTTGNIWNFVGYISLLVGVGASVALILNRSDLSADNGVYQTIFLAIKGGILLTLLLSSSKYAFTISKSYINESLKVADRIHAISFGKFYLKVFEKELNSNDFKEIFQHWNLSKESSFSTISTENYDSKSLESIIKLIENLKDVVKK